MTDQQRRYGRLCPRRRCHRVPAAAAGRPRRAAGADPDRHPPGHRRTLPGRLRPRRRPPLAQLRPAPGRGPGDRAGSCTWPGSAPETRSASGFRPAPTSSTSPSWPCCWSGRPTSRWTPTIRTNGPDWSSARPGSPASCAPAARLSRTASGPGRSLPRRPPGPDDDAWVIFTSGSTGTPKGVAVRHRSAAAFVDAEARIFLQDEPIGPAGPRAGRPVRGLRRLLRGNVARVAPRRLPGARTPGAGADRHGPRPLADQPRHHRGLHRPHARRALARGVPGKRPAADLRRRGLPAGARRAARRRGPRGLEHLRPHRGHRRGLRGAAGRARPGQDRPAAGRLGPRRRRRRCACPSPKARWAS